MVKYLGLADYLLIGEAVLGVPAEVLALSANLHLADSALNAPAASFGGHELYPSFEQKAAVLCVRMCNNHLLLDRSKPVAYEVLREFVARNGYEWTDPAGDDPHGDETVKTMWGVAAGRIDEIELTSWIAERLGGHMR
jgi:prophage maintenance system killer protein